MILEKWCCTEVQAHCVYRRGGMFWRQICVVRAAIHSMYTFMYFSTHAQRIIYRKLQGKYNRWCQCVLVLCILVYIWCDLPKNDMQMGCSTKK